MSIVIDMSNFISPPSIAAWLGSLGVMVWLTLVVTL